MCIFASFGQNTAEFYDKHSFNHALYIFWPEFGLKPSYFALHLMKNGKVILKQFQCLRAASPILPSVFRLLPEWVRLSNQGRQFFFT